MGELKHSQPFSEIMMRRCDFAPAVVFLFLSFCPALRSQDGDKSSAGRPRRVLENDDPRNILEVGAATSWTVSGGAATFAPNLAAETTPIENWLEIEAGVSPFYTRNSTEWDVDLLFKKPWTLSPKAEAMLGIGPGYGHLKQNGKVSQSISGEIAGDVMFWPGGRHRFGWFMEPAYQYSFAAGHQQSLGLTAGLLIGLVRKPR